MSAIRSKNGFRYQDIYASFLFMENIDTNNVIEQEIYEDISIRSENNRRSLYQLKKHDNETTEYLNDSSGLFKVVLNIPTYMCMKIDNINYISYNGDFTNKDVKNLIGDKDLSSVIHKIKKLCKPEGKNVKEQVEEQVKEQVEKKKKKKNTLDKIDTVEYKECLGKLNLSNGFNVCTLHECIDAKLRKKYDIPRDNKFILNSYKYTIFSAFDESSFDTLNINSEVKCDELKLKLDNLKKEDYVRYIIDVMNNATEELRNAIYDDIQVSDLDNTSICFLLFMAHSKETTDYECRRIWSDILTHIRMSRTVSDDNFNQIFYKCIGLRAPHRGRISKRSIHSILEILMTCDEWKEFKRLKL